MEQINMSASMADQYLQSQVARNKEFLKSQDIPMMKAPSVDAGANTASLQSVGKVLPDQAELTATGQGFVKEKQNLQNAGIPGSSLENNASSASVALNQVAGVRDLQRNRELIQQELQYQVDTGKLKVPISETLNLSSSKALADETGKQRVLQTVPPSLVERRLAHLYGKDSSKLANKYGINPIEQTQRKQNLQLYTLTGNKRLLYEVIPSSVRMAGQNVSVLPVTDFTYNPNIRALTSRLLDSKPVKGEGGKLIYGQGKLAELSDRTEKLYSLRRKFQELGGQTAKEKIAGIDTELTKIDNFYKGLQERGLPLSTTGYTGAPFISGDSQISLKVPSVGELTGPNAANILASRKQKARAKQDAYVAAQLPQLRDELRQLEIQKQELLNKGFKKYSPEVASIQAGIDRIYNPAGPKVGLYGGQHNQSMPPYRKGDPVRPQDRGRYFGLMRTSEGFAKNYNQKPPVEVGAYQQGIRFYAETYSPTGSKVGTAKAGTAGEGGQVSMQNLSSQLAINPASVQVRQERRVKDTKQKGGGGRNVAEFVGGEMGEQEDTARAFMAELLNAQKRSTTGNVINQMNPNVRYTTARRPRVIGRESLAGSPQVVEKQTYTSPPGTSKQIVSGGSTEYQGMREYDMETGGLPKTSPDDRTQTRSVKDIYGIRRESDIPDAKGRKPTAIPPSKKPLDIKQKVSKEAQEIMKRSLKISEDRRRARIEGAAPVNYDSYLNKKPLGSYVPAEEKPVKRGKSGSLLGEFLSKNYYSVNKFPSI